MKTSRLILVGVVLAAVAIGAFFAFHMFMAPPDDLDLAREKTSAGGLYAVAMQPEAGEARQGEIHSWVVTVKTPDGAAVEGAEIAIDGGMPQHGHGLPTAPQATAYLGEGRYRIEGVRFNMSGWWVLKIGVKAAPGADSAEFNLVL